MKNVRFWEYINGAYVRITLQPGQSLSWYQGGPTDEGWSSQAEKWSLSDDGAFITRESVSDGCDCDGRLTRGYDVVASADRSTFVECYEFDGMRPDWQDVEGWQRDAYAEAAGY